MELAAAYLRVSTEEQAAYSPDAQLAEIQAFAKKNGYHIPEEWVFLDEGISGRKAENRPAFQRMVRLAKQKDSGLQAVLVHKYDRFARSREDAVLYKALLKKHHVKVVSVMEPVPEDDKFAVIYESMLEAMAEYYSLNLAEEVNKTMRKKAENGEWQTAAPFGYRNQNKTLVIVPEEAEAIREIFRQYAAGVPIPALAHTLNALGLRTHQGGVFESRTVRYILHNPVYCGWLRWTPGKRQDRDYFSPAAILAKGSWEPILSDSLWDAAAQRLQKERQTEKRPRPAPAESHWLSGMVKCSACGGVLAFGARFQNGARQMQCSGYSHGKCAVSHAVSSARLIPALLSALETAGQTPSPLSYAVRPKVSTEQATVSLLLEKACQRLRKAKDAYLNGIDSMEEYRETKEKTEAEIAALEKQLAALAPKNVSGTEKLALCNLPSLFLSENCTVEEKRLALHALLEKAVFEKKRDCLQVILLWE